MHHAVRVSRFREKSRLRWRSRADADPPRHVAGGASLGRVRPLAFMSFSQAPPLRVRCRSAASCAVRPTFVEVCGESDLREPSPHSVMRFRHHSSMDRTRSIVSCEARLRVPRSRKVAEVIPPSCASRTRSLRPLSARSTSRHCDDPSCLWTGTRRVDVT